MAESYSSDSNETTEKNVTAPAMIDTPMGPITHPVWQLINDRAHRGQMDYRDFESFKTSLQRLIDQLPLVDRQIEFDRATRLFLKAVGL